MRTKVNFTGITQCALTAYSVGAGVAGTDLKVQYFDGSTWQDTGVTLAIGASSGQKEGTYQSVAAGARADLIMLRLFLDEGAGTTADIAFGNINMTCKP